MAVNGELLVYPGQELTPQDFAMMMERISVIRSGILNGCEVTFEENESGEKTSILNIEKGYVFVRGRLIKVNKGTLDTSSLSATASSWFVYARVHLNDIEPSPEDLCTIFVTDSVPTDETESFNEENTGVAYATIATIKVSDKTINQTFMPEIGTVKSFLLKASDWAGATSGGYELPIITLSDPNFAENSHIDIIPRTIGYDYWYLRTLQAANIMPFSISNGELKLAAYGVTPTSDIEIGIVFKGNM
jgi:hypothetical protein